jgi:hypothetical protein
MKMYGTLIESILTATLLFILTSTPGYAQADPIKIRFVGDFSDVTKVYCRSAYWAAQMAVKEINDAGGLLDRPVELILFYLSEFRVLCGCFCRRVNWIRPNQRSPESVIS